MKQSTVSESCVLQTHLMGLKFESKNKRIFFFFFVLSLFFKDTDVLPLEYCGECVQKLWLACDVKNPVLRYRSLCKFLERNNLMADAAFAKKILKRVQ
jgi:hypothetical protein